MAAGDFTLELEDARGSVHGRFGTVEGPASYSAGGFVVSPERFGFSKLRQVAFEPIRASSSSFYHAAYDRNTTRVQVFESGGAGAPLAEVADGTDLSALAIRVKLEGRR